jgi:hypothetical protein
MRRRSSGTDTCLLPGSGPECLACRTWSTGCWFSCCILGGGGVLQGKSGWVGHVFELDGGGPGERVNVFEQGASASHGAARLLDGGLFGLGADVVEAAALAGVAVVTKDRPHGTGCRRLVALGASAVALEADATEDVAEHGQSAGTGAAGACVGGHVSIMCGFGGFVKYLDYGNEKF